MKITKIKKDGEFAVVTYEVGDGLSLRTITCRGLTQPSEQFLNAMDRLLEQARIICELPKDYFKPLKQPDKLFEDTMPSGEVTGVTFTYSASGKMSAVITVKKNLHGTHSPLAINTPGLPVESDKGPELPPECVDILDELIEAARYYVSDPVNDAIKAANLNQVMEQATEALANDPKYAATLPEGSTLTIQTGGKTATVKGTKKEAATVA